MSEPRVHQIPRTRAHTLNREPIRSLGRGPTVRTESQSDPLDMGPQSEPRVNQIPRTGAHHGLNQEFIKSLGKVPAV